MAKIRATDQAHSLLSRHVQTGDCAIDATTGNGHDTCFLAALTGGSGTVYGFDIQHQAISETRKLYYELNRDAQLTLFEAGHENIRKLIPSKLHNKVSAITFNLGYLPKGDKSVTTTKTTTLPALRDSLSLLRPNGIITILAYRGHQGGEDEYLAITNWLTQLPTEHFETNIIQPENAGGPVLFAVIKRPLD
ncbi:MAG: methyltransferase domain-containing protein [Aestuariibacter sp.]|nr:methyltransferase domain-containing protein [Aestuariibacter sp.]